MADPRNYGDGDKLDKPAGGSAGAARDHGAPTTTERDLGLGYGGSEDGGQGRRSGPLYDPGRDPGLGFGGSDERGRSADIEGSSAVGSSDRVGAGAADYRAAGSDEGLARESIGAPTDLIRSTKVKGTDVYNDDGEHLGHIDDVVLSKREGRVVYAIMSFGGFLGLGERYHPLPWDKLDYDPNRGGYVVTVSRAQLEGAPSYRPGEEPNWNDPGYGGELTRYYVPPLL